MQKANQIHLAAISYSLLLGQIFKLDMLRIGKMLIFVTLMVKSIFTCGN
ncbi:MAG: hypothetical protein ACLRQF_11810 [Thomasclavelia ramosa]